MIQKTTLSFHLENIDSLVDVTSFGGLPMMLELALSCGLMREIESDLSIQGKECTWKDNFILFSLMLLGLAGGQSVEDIDRLEMDAGLRKFFLRFCHFDVDRRKRRSIIKKMSKRMHRAFPSKSTILRWLRTFHNPPEEEKRVEGRAFIPEDNIHLKALAGLNRKLCGFVHKKSPSHEITLDVDATLAKTNHRSALCCYKGYLAWQPLNVWWAEKKMMFFSEFRDGNVPAGFELLRVFKDCVCHLPDGISTVNLRSDSAAYQKNIMRWCERTEEHPAHKINFVIGADFSQSLKKAVSEIEEGDWHELEEEEESKQRWREKNGCIRKWAEVCFVPEWAAYAPKDE